MTALAQTITGVVPNTGPAAGGTNVVIAGTGFLGATGATFGGVAGTSFRVTDDSHIAVTTPAGSGTVDVTVATQPAPVTATGAFTYAAPPTISSVSPSSGSTAGGDPVAINGTGLLGATTLTFGPASAPILTNSDTKITTTSPAGSAGAVTVTVTTPGGSATGTFTYVAPPPTPTISSVSPSSGSTAGGDPVAINGTGLLGATTLTFGPASAPILTNSDTKITTTSPAGSAGAVTVTVTTPGGSATGTFTYVAPALTPTVSSVVPNSGPTAGGTPVTITGTNFITPSTVKFGTVAATGVTVNSTTSISATSPAGSGAVDVTVTTAGGTSATGTADLFTYAGAPTVTLISPNGGPPTGGTQVTITGSNFTPTSTVKFGTAAGTGVVYTSSSQIKATSPAGTSGAVVDVTVTTIGGTSATGSADLFTYATAPTWGPPPNVTALAGHLSAVVSWTAAISNGSTISAYAVTSTPVGPTTSVSCVPPAPPCGTTISVTVTGLSGGVSYTFIVTAINAFGSTPSAPSNSVTVAGAGSTCITATLSPIPATPALQGTPIAVNASSTGCPNPIYEFWLRYPDNTVLLQRIWSSTATWTWSTGSYPLGSYQIRMGANQSGDSTASFEAKAVYNFTLVSGCADALIGAGAASPQEVGAQVTFTTTFAPPGALCATPEYQFWWQFAGGSWNIGRPFGPTNTWTWATAGFQPGSYKIVVWVNQSGTSTTTYQSYAQMIMVLTGCFPVTASTSPAPPQHTGTAVTVTGLAHACTQPRYQFWKLDPGSSTWVLVQSYTVGTATFNWSATGQVLGTYSFMVWAIDTNSAGAAGNSLGHWDSYIITKYPLISSNACVAVSLNISPASPTQVGAAVSLTSTAAGCSSPLYQFWMLPPGSSTWQILRAYLSTNSYQLPAGVRAPGTYNFAVWVRDATSAGIFTSSLGRYDALNNSLYSMTTCTSVTVTSSPPNTAPAGTNPVTLTSTASGCSNATFQFWILPPGSSTWVDVQPYSNGSPTFNWNTTGWAKGTYHFSVWVKSSSSTGATGNNLGRWDAYSPVTTYTLT